jgi:poly-gamma-glutamate synthesis protein (capsule biosynthesis protein)
MPGALESRVLHHSASRCVLAALLLSCCLLGTSADRPGLDFSQSRFDQPPPAPPLELGCGDQATLIFVGDTKLGGRTAQQIARHGADYPFALVTDVLNEADICFANYESAITDYGRSTPGKPQSLIAAGRAFVFKSDPATTGSILSAAGIDIVQLANNHAMDYCGQGLLDTCAALDASGIGYVGAGPDSAGAAAPLVIDSAGYRVGYLAYSLINPPGSRAAAHSAGINALWQDYRKQLEGDIAQIRERCDIVAVGVHWGIESTTVPNKLQRDVGHAAIDAGADLVIGTHPHSMQGIEFYKQGLIAYSLGNFVFTGASSRLAGCVLAVNLPFNPGGVRRPSAERPLDWIELLPCWIKDGRPAPSTDQRLVNELQRLMRATGSKLTPIDEDPRWLAVEPRS